MIGIVSINSLIFAAASSSHTSTTFCHPSSLINRAPSANCIRKGGILYASIVPKPSRVDAGSKGTDDSKHSLQSINHDLIVTGEHAVIPNVSTSGNQFAGSEVSGTGNIGHQPNQVQTQTQQLTQTPQQINDNITLAGIALFLSLAVGAVMKYSPPGCWRYYLAGGICASTSHAMTTPIDVVKVISICLSHDI